MYDLFHIVEVSPQWYTLLLKDTFTCVASGADLSKIRQVIYDYVRKYKTEERVFRMTRLLSDGGRVSGATFNKRQKDYLEGKHLVFNDLVRGAVKEAIKDNREDTPYRRLQNKVKTVVPTKKEILPPTNIEVKVTKKVSALKVRRTPLTTG